MNTLLQLILTVVHPRSTENQGGAVRHTFDAFKNLRLAEGTGTGQADKAFSDRRTLSASSNEDLDFAGGFTDPFGTTVTLAKAKLIIIYNRSTTQTLTVKPASSNGITGIFGAATHTKDIKPGGVELWYNPAGWTITAGTGDLLNVANASGSSADYDIFVVGTSA